MTKNTADLWKQRVDSFAERAVEAAADQLRAVLGGSALAPRLQPVPVRVRNGNRSGRR